MSFGIGILELLIIGVVGLLLLGLLIAAVVSSMRK